MSAVDKSAYGVVIGFGGMAVCVVLAVFMANGPAMRAFLLWLVTPQFAIGLFGGMALACLCALAFVKAEA